MKKLKMILGMLVVGVLVTAGIAIAQGPITKQPSIPEPAAGHSRIIVPLESFSGVPQGCKIIHKLNDAMAMRCPKGTRVEGAVEDKIYRIMDMGANEQINVDDVWEMELEPPITGERVTVAVLDTGINTNHPELKASIAGGMGFGYPDYEDDNGHGTHVAGIITADGVVNTAKGVAPDAKVWMAKVLDSSGSGYATDIAAAIEYVVKGDDGRAGTGDEPAKIISMSLGNPYFGTTEANCDKNYLARKINWAVRKGVIVVVAAGNTAGVVSSPACASKAIAVGAVDKNNVRAPFSGTGKALDIMAPGVSIYSTVIDDYEYKDGTSMATPHVSATVALMKQKNPTWTDAEIKGALYNTAVDLELSGREQGNGRVDAYGAVNYTGEAPSPPSSVCKPRGVKCNCNDICDDPKESIDSCPWDCS